jgi:hypothetical protein
MNRTPDDKDGETRGRVLGRVAYLALIVQGLKGFVDYCTLLGA